jgi:inner membrane protein
MASAFGHSVAAFTITKLGTRRSRSWKLIFIAILGSIVPDLDTLGFKFGIEYGSIFGHRGFTLSLLFALIWSPSSRLKKIKRAAGETPVSGATSGPF